MRLGFRLCVLGGRCTLRGVSMRVIFRVSCLRAPRGVRGG